MKWTSKEKRFIILGSVGLFLVLVFGIFLLINHNSIDFKSEEDRMSVTEEEIEIVREKTLEIDGVVDFTIHKLPDGGIYGELIVESKDNAKSIAKDVFSLMVRETVGVVDLFVKLDDEDNTLLIQAFKPEGEDRFFEWDILY